MNNNLNGRNTNNRNGKNNKGSFFRNYGFLIIILCALICSLVFFRANVNTEELTINNVIEKIETGEIEKLYIQNGNEKALVLLKDATDEEKADFPNRYKYWFVLSNQNISWVYETVQNTDLNGDGHADVEILTGKTPVNISTYIMPALYIIILLTSLILIYRFLTKTAGGKNGSFGKSKIKNGQMSKIKFADVAGINEEKEELEEIVDFLKSPTKYIELGARIPKGVLLVGDPGTGKTLLAKAIAGESGVPFFSMSGSDFVEMFVGVGASRVRDLFVEAKKNAPCIVFIDEIDAVGRRRGTGGNGGNDEREQTLNQLLVEMDGFEGNEGIIIIAATNRADILDPALTRPGRFDRKIAIYPPDIKGREDILKIHAKNKRLSKDIDFKVIAKITSGFTGANLESLMNEAALRAARNGKPEISMVDITESVNKVILGVQKKSRVIVEKDRQITAYHESGHAILGLMLPNCSEVQEVSIIPRGFAGGYTLSREEDNTYMTFNKLNDEIAMTMGGRIAEKLKFEDITTGASNDIVQATKLARKMVTEWGMGDMGFINYADNEDLFLSTGIRNNVGVSDKTSEEIDAQVKEIIDKNYKRAVKILTDNMLLLDEMAKVLLARETIYKEDLEKLLAGVCADDLIVEIEEREARKQKDEFAESIKYEIIRVLSDVIKGKNSLLIMESAGGLNKESYNKLYEGMKAEYNEKRKLLLQKIQENNLEERFSESLIEFEDINNLSEIKISSSTLDTALNAEKNENEDKKEESAKVENNKDDGNKE